VHAAHDLAMERSLELARTCRCFQGGDLGQK